MAFNNEVLGCANKPTKEEMDGRILDKVIR